MLLSRFLPGVVREQLVGFCHFVGVFTPRHRSTLFTVSLDQLVGKTLSHGLSTSASTSFDDGSHSQCLSTTTGHLDGNLIGRSTHSSRPNLDLGHHIVDRGQKDIEWLGIGNLFSQEIHGFIKDPTGDGFFTIPHESVDELRHHHTVESWIRLLEPLCRTELLLDDFILALGQDSLPRYFFFFLPYFERPCLRSSTPEQSKVPRTT